MIQMFWTMDACLPNVKEVIYHEGRKSVPADL